TVLSMILLAAPSAAALAQSPNTAAIVVVVVDQTGALVPDARVTIVNTSTGASRGAVSGPNGSVTIPARSITGEHTVPVAKAGFTPEDVGGVALRAGETASVHMRLVASGGNSEVTVYGTTEGIRTDPELGTRLDSEVIDQTPVLGRKISALPLLNAAMRP